MRNEVYLALVVLSICTLKNKNWIRVPHGIAKTPSIKIRFLQGKRGNTGNHPAAISYLNYHSFKSHL